MYKLAVKESLDRNFKKLKKQDREMLVLIARKVREILEDPHRFVIVQPQSHEDTKILK